MKLLQSCPTPSDPMDCSLPGSSIHGILQARVLEWGAIAFSKICPLGDYNVSVWASLVAQLVKNLPAMQEIRLRSLGWEDPLEKEMATHSSILA